MYQHEPYLETEALDLMRGVADAARQVPRDERTFLFNKFVGGTVVRGRNIALDVFIDDYQQLVAHGYFRVVNHGGHGSETFVVTQAAYDRLASEAAAEPMEQVEEEIARRYLDSDRFAARYPLAHQRWSEAAALLWSTDAADELTTIGHKTREAVQAFAGRLVELHRVANTPADPAKTVARIRAVIDGHRGRLGKARSGMLDALIAYWGEVNDLLQRQEHGGQKEGEPLTWEDGRRAVFQTAVVMYEIDRTVAP